jgi:phosphoribosylglycinamide formyltransferase-1
VVKTAILVSGGGTNLQAILDAHLFGEIKNCELTAVISSSPDAYAVTRAENCKIPVYIVDHEIFPNNTSFSEAIMKKLFDLDIELAVLAGFNHQLEDNFYDGYRGRVLNVYPALLPAFFAGDVGSIHVHEDVLAFGAKVTGATAYFAIGGSAPGPIIIQKVVPVQDDDTPETLQRRVLEQCEWQLYPQVVQLYCAGLLKITGRHVTLCSPETQADT